MKQQIYLEEQEMLLNSRNNVVGPQLGKESGDAYREQATTLEKMGERDEAATCYLNASKSYKKEFPKGGRVNVEAVDCLKAAVVILCEKGRFSAAASNQKQIAEIYETDIIDYAASMDAYDQAAEWYTSEDSTAYHGLM